jgi:hypothetical protein
VEEKLLTVREVQRELKGISGEQVRKLLRMRAFPRAFKEGADWFVPPSCNCRRSRSRSTARGCGAHAVHMPQIDRPVLSGMNPHPGARLVHAPLLPPFCPRGVVRRFRSRPRARHHGRITPVYAPAPPPGRRRPDGDGASPSQREKTIAPLAGPSRLDGVDVQEAVGFFVGSCWMAVAPPPEPFSLSLDPPVPLPP